MRFKTYLWQFSTVFNKVENFPKGFLWKKKKKNNLPTY